MKTFKINKNVANSSNQMNAEIVSVSGVENRYHSLNGAKPESHTRGNLLMSEKGADVKFCVRKYTHLLIAVMICSMSFGQVKVLSNGYMGIGTANPTHKLDMRGTVRFGMWDGTWEAIRIDWNNQWGAAQMYCTTENFTIGTDNYYVGQAYLRYLRLKANPTITSDLSLKQNIKPIETPLQKLMQVEGKSYNYIDDSKDLKITPLKEKITKPTFGFIAQDLEKIFPELVQAPDEMNEHYGVDYIAMIPVLVEAIKEQQVKIEILTDALNACCKASQQKSATTDNDSNSEQSTNTTDEMRLYQNAPNPFNEVTTIQCYIPQTMQNVQLCVYNMTGTLLKCVVISARGATEVQIQAGQLAAGIYTYLLIADGKASEAKNMIITK